MLGRPCCFCGRPGKMVMTAPGVTQNICPIHIDLHQEAMPKGFPKAVAQPEPIPTREPRSKRLGKARKRRDPTDVAPSTRKPTKRKPRKESNR